MAYAEDQESAIRNHRWTDPRLGQQTVQSWANQWYASLDLEPASTDYYRSMLENRVLPQWGDRPLSSLADAEFEVTAWEKRLAGERTATTVLGPRGAVRDAR